MRIWECKVGRMDSPDVPLGADSPMRRAVEECYLRLTGKYPEFTFSGWGAGLTEGQLSVVEDRLPNEALTETGRMARLNAALAAAVEMRDEAKDYVDIGWDMGGGESDDLTMKIAAFDALYAALEPQGEEETE